MDDHIRVCFISFAFSPLVGGSEVQAEKQARQLQKIGHDVIVITLRHDRNWKRAEILDGLPVSRVGGIYRRDGSLRLGRLGYFIDISLFLTLWRLRHHYDVIHAFQLSPLAAVALIIGKLVHKPVIINIQSAGPSKAQSMQIEREVTLMADTLTNTDFLKIDPSQKWMVDGGGDIAILEQTVLAGRAIVNALRKSDAFYQVLSTRSRSYLTSQGFREERIIHITNGIDTELFRPDPQRRPDPALPERVITCVARLEYPKGVDVLLHAWGRMMREPSAWRAHLKPKLRVVGRGEFRSQMERIAGELGIQDSVEFLGLRRDVIDLLQQSWAFAIPSRWEGMPNALLEAMACGLPCVATRVSGSEDVIKDGVNGLLVEPENPAELARALRCLIEDIDLAQRLGREARTSMVHGYQLSSIVDQCLHLYRRVLHRSRHTLPLALQGGRGDE